MSLNNFIATAFAQAKPILPQKTLTIDGVDIVAVFSDEGYYNDNGILGGFEAQDNITVSISTGDLSSLDVIDKRVQLDGVYWTIEKITRGDVLTSIELVNPNQHD